MADQLLSAHAERSTWWDRSWYSGTSWFSAQYYRNQSQSHDWATSLSHQRPQPLVQSSTPSPSTIAATHLPQTSALGLDVSTQTSVLSLDASTQTVQHRPTLLQDASSQVCPGQCYVQRRLYTTLLFRVLRTEHPLQGTAAAPIPLPQPGDIDTVTVPTVPAATVDPFQCRIHSATGHRFHLQDLKNRPSWEFHTTSLLKQPTRLPSTHGLCSSSPDTQLTSQHPPAPCQYPFSVCVCPVLSCPVLSCPVLSCPEFKIHFSKQPQNIPQFTSLSGKLKGLSYY